MENNLAFQVELAKQPTLTFCPHPLLNSKDREVFYSSCLPGETIADYLTRLKVPVSGHEWVLYLQDKEIPQQAWSEIVIHEGELITLKAKVLGGGGDKNKSIRTILTIVVLMYAQNYSGAAKVAIAAIGSYAVSALFPPVFPPVEENRGEETSPTYSISGGSNRARLFKPMPCVVGAHKIFPDLGAKTYTEFQGEDQFLYQVFNFGLTDISLSDYRIGETAITDYTDYTLEESDATGALNLFPANVDTSAGAALTEPAGWITRTSGLLATALAVELAGYLFRSGQSGIEQWTVDIEIEYRKVGDVPWLPFNVTSSNTIKHSSRQPLRVGYQRAVASGQYEVRCRRTTLTESDTRVSSSIDWTQLRTYQPDTVDYSGQKRVALRIRANEQLQGMVNTLSATATLSCPVWNGATWITQASSNPAWLFLYWAKGKLLNGRRVFGGGLTDADIDIELIKEWGAWCDTKGLTCNLVFDRDMSVEQQLIIIARCGRAHPTRGTGKVGVIWDQAGQLPVAFFGMSNIRKGSFTVNYARKRRYDEIALNFINPALNWQPDTVRALATGVTDPEETLTVELMGCTDEVMAGKEANLIMAETEHRRRATTWETDMEGLVVTRGDVVGLAHDLTQWAYSGRLVSGTNNQLVLDGDVVFSSGFDHYLRLVYPDGSDDIFSITYVIGSTNTISLVTKIVKDDWLALTAYVLNAEVKPTVANGYYYVASVAGSSGAAEPAWPLTVGDTVVDGGVTWKNAGPAQVYYPDNNPDHKQFDYKFFFEPQATPGKLLKITDVKPIDDHYVRLTAVDEVDDYYLSESNSYTHVSTTPGAITPTITKLEVSDTLINVGNSYAVRITVAWDTTGPYDFAVVRAAPTGEVLQIIDRTFDRRAEFNWTYVGSLDIEVTVLNADGVYSNAGKSSVTHIIIGQDQLPDDVTNLQINITATSPVLKWDDVNAADLLDYEIREGTDWDTATLLGRVDANEYPLDWLTIGLNTFLVKARDASWPRNVSANATSLGLTVVGSNPPNITPSFEADNLVINYTVVEGTLPIKEFKISYGVAVGDNVVATINANRFSITANWLGARTWWVTPVDMGGNDGSSSSAEVSITSPGVSDLKRKVIQNQVALTWTESPGTLPIAEYRVYKGDVFATADFLGTITATFNIITEISGGLFTYWVVAVDVAGNQGTEVSVVANVGSPPGFLLKEDWLSTFPGTKINCFVNQDGDLLAPVNITETWTDHFVNNAWSDPDAQIAAGFPYYAMPSEATASYEEEFDYGTALEGTLITVDKNIEALAGVVTEQTTISYKLLSGDPWIDTAGVDQIFATDFRYIKVKFDFTSAGGDDLILFKQLNVRLSVEEIIESGNATAVSTDVGGTVIVFTKSFVAVESIEITYAGTTSVSVAAPLPAGSNPTQFVVYLFDSTTGARVSGPFSWIIKGN